MVKRAHKAADGMYHINGKKYAEYMATGSGARRKVMNGTAYMTNGGLKKGDLEKNAHGDIVSKKKSKLARTQKHLKGFLQPKGSGKFGPKTARKHRRSRRKH